MFSQASPFLPYLSVFFPAFFGLHCHVFIDLLTDHSLATMPGLDLVWCVSWGSHPQYGGGSGVGISSLPGPLVCPQQS